MPLVLVGLGVLISAAFILAASQTFTMWLRPLNDYIHRPQHGLFKKAVKVLATPLVISAQQLEHEVRSVMSRWAVGHLPVLARWFSGLTAAALAWNAEIAHVADDVADALSVLRHHTIPRLIRHAIRPVDRLAHRGFAKAVAALAFGHYLERRFLHGIDRLQTRLEHLIARRIHGIDRLIREHVIPRIRALERAITVALPRRLLRAERRLSRLEKALGLAALTGVVLRVLARRFPWLFCRTWTRLGRRICGVNPSYIDDVFGLLLTAEVIANLPTLVRVMQSVTRETAEGIRDLSGV